MSKSILVINTPESCFLCQFSYSCSVAGNYCSAKNTLISEREYFDKKPDWCPLKDVPEKQNYKKFLDDDAEPYCTGYNDCVDRILEGENVNE